MKIGGKKVLHGPATEIIVFAREDVESSLAFRATAMLDKSEFDKFCPMPKPPKMRVKGGNLVENPDDPKFKVALDQYNKNFMDYMFVSSLTALPLKEGEPDLPIEWEKVKIPDKHTWHFWEDELKEAGLSDMERKRLFNTVMGVNSLNEAKMDEARASFLQRQREEPEVLSFPTDERNDTPSGEHVNGSASDLPESQNAGTILMKK